MHCDSAKLGKNNLWEKKKKKKKKETLKQSSMKTFLHDKQGK